MKKGQTILIGIFIIVIVAAFLLYIFWPSPKKTFKGFIEIDETNTACTGTIITVYVRNRWITSMTASNVTLSGTNSQGNPMVEGLCGPSIISLPPDASPIQCNTTLTGTAGVNTIRVDGPTTSVQGTVYCRG